MAAKRRKLQLSYDPHIIDHLGIKMYANLPNVLAELIANAYDADAQNVSICLYDRGGEKRIKVIDDGLGMSFDEINDKFLKIGRRKRNEDNDLTPFGRKITGRKGLGKLAFFGIGEVIRVTTHKKGERISFDLDWNRIISTKKGIYEPAFKTEKICEGSNTGTQIEITNLKRKSSFDLQSLADSVSKLFNFYDDDFKVTLYFNDENPVAIDRKRKYQNIGEEFTWSIPKDYQIGREKDGIKGTIYASEKPLKPDLRGITLYARGRMVNSPEFFGVGESSHAYSYLTGWIDVDYIDGGEEDLISTQRTSLRWEEPEAEELRLQLQELLKKVEKDWRKKRKESRVREITRESNLNIEKWVGSQSKKTGEQLDFLIKSLTEEPAIPKEVGKSTLEAIHKLIPEYADFHWRQLHEQIKAVASSLYHKREYYPAVFEAIKRYETQVRRKTNSSLDGQNLMQFAFSPEKEAKKGLTHDNEKEATGPYKLSVMKNKRKSDQSPFSEETIQNIEDGQRYLSVGVVAGIRNPLAHEEIKELQSSSVFSEKDCLDSLSLLSMLFTKLDGAERR